MATLEELERGIEQAYDLYQNEKDPEQKQIWLDKTLTLRDAYRDMQPADKPGMVEDVVKGAGSGLIQGAAALLGTPGTVANLFDDGMNAGMNALTKAILGREGRWGERPPLPEDATKLEKLLYGDGTSPLDMGSMQKLASNLTGGFADYEPEYLPGRITQTVSSFAPGAAMSAPAQGMKMGAALTKYALTPGVASELAGEMTKGTKAEPIARTAAALLAPSVLTKGGFKPGGRMPTAKQVIKQGKQELDNFSQANLPYDATKFNRAVNRGIQKAIDQKATPEFAKKGHRQAQAYKVDPIERPVVDSARIRNITDEFGKYKKPTRQTGKNKQVAYHVNKELEAFAADPSNLAPGVTAGRNWPGADLAKGKKNYHQGKKAKTVKSVTKGKTSEARRNKAERLLDKVEEGGYGYTPEELALLERMASGGKMTSVGEVAHSIGGPTWGPPLRMASMGLLAGPSKFADVATRMRANKLIKQMIKDAPAAKSNIAAQPAPWAQYRIPQKEIEKMLQHPALKDALLRGILYGGPETRR